MPFATTHEPAVESLRSKWPWLVVALYFYGFHLAIVQAWCLSVPHPAGRSGGRGPGGLATAMLRARHRLRHRAVTFDAEPEKVRNLAVVAGAWTELQTGVKPVSRYCRAIRVLGGSRRTGVSNLQM